MSYSAAGERAGSGPLARTREFLDMIRFEHTVFALPFAYMTLFVASGGWPQPGDALWITGAMVGGRTLGMAANRLIDARIDARNPRTKGRSLPAGRLSSVEVGLFVVVATAVFLVAVYRLSPLAQKLWPFVILVMVVYPYTKRFTWLCHLALGLVYVMIPTGVWVAVRNALPMEALWLGVGAGLWVAGFDIIYACQDVDVDRSQNLHSMPADLGLGRALAIARLFHVAFFVTLLGVGWMIGAGVLYYAGLSLSGLLLVYEHRLVSPTDLSRVNAAFFTINGAMSIVFFLCVAADVVVHHG